MRIGLVRHERPFSHEGVHPLAAESFRLPPPSLTPAGGARQRLGCAVRRRRVEASSLAFPPHCHDCRPSRVVRRQLGLRWLPWPLILSSLPFPASSLHPLNSSLLAWASWRGLFAPALRRHGLAATAPWPQPLSQLGLGPLCFGPLALAILALACLVLARLALACLALARFALACSALAH